MPERALAYDPRFDISAYQNEHSTRTVLDRRTRRNLETNLGERFNVELSQVDYFLEENKLKNKNHDEPFEDVIKRGIEHRSGLSTANDQRREQSELAGFQRVQEILSSESFDPSVKVVIISPKGESNSTYQQNFFDIYEKNGERIKMARYPTKLSYEQFYEAARQLDPASPTPTRLTDAYFLAHPVTTSKTRAEILEKIPVDEHALKKQEFQKLITACSPLITSYVNTLATSSNEAEIHRHYNAILNYADQVARESAPQTRTVLDLSLSRLIDHYGNQPVRPVVTGCGLQGGFGSTEYDLRTMNYSPFSVSEFAKGGCSECGGDSRHFHCPGCSSRIPSGLGITKCPHCNLTKEQAGSRCY